MASQKEPTSQANEHSDNRNLRGARIHHQGYFEACKNVCMCSLPYKIHSSLQPSTAYPNMRPRKNDDRLPGRKSRSTADSFREGFLSKTFSFSRISSLARTLEAAQRKIHIHHAACGHGVERWVERAPVDGYNHEMRTVFQYHGCHWHGCRKCYPNDCNKIIARDNQT